MKKKLFKGMVRHRLARSLGVGSSKNINDSKDVAEKWKRVIKYLISGKTLTKAEVDTVPELSPRKYTVYVNPFSGQGKALQMYNGPVRAMLAEAEINHKMIKTEYGGHARKMVKDLNLAECEGIIIVSGDGLVHEVINGLMERTDWEKAIKTPIGIVPGGSGNALAASVIYASTGLHPVPANVTSSVFQICRGRVEDIDIMAIETKSETNPDETVVKYGLLGLVIGIIADIDIESEYLRKLGQVFRTTLYAVMRILCLRTYNITVSYLPVTSKTLSVHESVGENISNGVDVLAAGDQPSVLRNHLLPSLNQENLPDNWITETDDFLLLMGANLTHLSQEVMINPDLDLNDGTIRLSKTKSGYSRLDLIRMWGRLEDGIGVVNDSHNVVNSC
uniref:DAGKc domain-containing protein n=1 Tax=Ciona savignyi TaxID=51511 RepID=H2ZQE6_CIOSA